MGGFHGTRIRILLALAVVLPALLALLALQFARDDAREASRTLSTLAMTQQLVEDQSNRNLTIRGELIAGNQAVVAYMTQALGSLLPGEAVPPSSIGWTSAGRSSTATWPRSSPPMAARWR